MDGAAYNCSVATATATTTIYWDLLRPEQTPIVLSNLESLNATPRWPYTDYLLQKTFPGLDEDEQYDTDSNGNRIYTADTLHLLPVPLPWLNQNDFLNEEERSASKKQFGSFNWTDFLATKHTFPHEFLNCSFQADQYIVQDDWRHIGKPLGKNRLLASCHSGATCERRCAALADIKDPSKLKLVLTVGGSIVAGIGLLAGVLACCTCAKGKRRVPRSTLPRQPTVHDPEPAMSQATQSPRVVLTPPAPAPAPASRRSSAAPGVPVPAPAQSPAPSQTFVRRVEDAAGQPPVVETTEEAAVAPGAVEEVVEPVVRSVPAQVARAPTQVVSRAPTGAL